MNSKTIHSKEIDSGEGFDWGVSMTAEELALWEADHKQMLMEYPEAFPIKHYVSVAWLKKK